MSALDAAGWALSSFQSVSVVPTIQCRPHGITNSTLVSVRRIIAGGRTGCGRAARRGGCPWTRAPGTGRARATSAWVSSVHTPVALMTCLGPHLELSVVLEVADPDPGDPLALAQEADDPGTGGDVRAVRRRRCGPGTWCAGRRRPARRSTAPRRRARPCCSAGHTRSACRRLQVAVVRHAARVTARDRHRVVEQHARSRRRAAPRAGASAGTGTAPAGRGAARAVCMIRPRSRSASRTSPKSSISR